MAQYRRAFSSRQNSAVHLHLNDKRQEFEDSNVHVLTGEKNGKIYHWPEEEAEDTSSQPPGKLCKVLQVFKPNSTQGDPHPFNNSNPL